MISFPSEIVARCVFLPEQTLKNVALWSATTKVFHEVINSEAFFKVLVVLGGSGDLLPYLTGKHQCFKGRYTELRGLCLKKMEMLSGAIYGDAFANVGGIELVSILNEIRLCKLEKDAIAELITIPDYIQQGQYQGTPYTFRTKDYFAIHDGIETCVYVCTLNGGKWAKFDLHGKVCQIHIDGNQLFVVRGGDRYYCLVVSNLELDPNQNYIAIELEGAYEMPVYFGREHLLYLEQTYRHIQPFALALSGLRGPDVNQQALSWQAGQEVFNVLKYFPYDNGFIEVSYQEALFITKIEISVDGFTREVISKDIKVDMANISDIGFHEDRLFIALKNSGTKIFSYDLLTKQLNEVLVIPAHVENTDFKSRFLCAAEKVYYLSMEMGKWGGDVEVKSHLTTLTYSRV